MRWWWIVLSLGVVAGCGPRSGGSAASGPSTTVTAGQSGYADYRSGMFLLDTASGDLERSVSEAQSAVGSLKGAMAEDLKDAIDMLNSAGATLSDVVEPAPANEEYAQKVERYEESRKRAIQGANEALIDMEEALGLIQGIAEAAKGPASQPLKDAAGSLADATDSTREAITTFGGTIEADQGLEEPAP